jgi:hypothetical protein
MACDATAMFKTAAELAKGTMGALKGFDPKALAGQDPKALLAKLPPGMAGMIPAGLDMKAAMANPGAFAGKIPASMMALLG